MDGPRPRSLSLSFGSSHPFRKQSSTRNVLPRRLYPLPLRQDIHPLDALVSVSPAYVTWTNKGVSKTPVSFTDRTLTDQVPLDVIIHTSPSPCPRPGVPGTGGSTPFLHTYFGVTVVRRDMTGGEGGVRSVRGRDKGPWGTSSCRESRCFSGRDQKCIINRTHRVGHYSPPVPRPHPRELVGKISTLRTLVRPRGPRRDRSTPSEFREFPRRREGESSGVNKIQATTQGLPGDPAGRSEGGLVPTF